MSSMTSVPAAHGFTPPPRTMLPDHTQLPDSDGLPVENFFEHPQSILLTTSLWATLEKRHPDGNFAVGQSAGIYFKPTDPALEGCRAPDWFYVPDVPPNLDGQFRRSYVMWQELQPPLTVIEFVSGDGSDERDRTPRSGKFWIYERAIRAGYYLIFDPQRQILEAHQQVNNRLQQMTPNARGRFAIEPLGIEFGIWHGAYLNHTMGWLRAWDMEGRLLLIPEEKAEAEKQRADRLAAQLRALGQEPDGVSG